MPLNQKEKDIRAGIGTCGSMLAEHNNVKYLLLELTNLRNAAQALLNDTNCQEAPHNCEACTWCNLREML